ncbi:unnamed protein product, partial [Mesorhabditis spiculigera]
MMPVNWSESTVPRFPVFVVLAYTQLIDLDAERQLFNLLVEIYVGWTDIRLVWNPADYGGIQYIWVNPEDVWIPENIVGNAKVLDEIYNEDYLSLKLWFNGTLVLARSYYAELSCPIDVGHFPFDRQKCQVVTMAVSYDQSSVPRFPVFVSLAYTKLIDLDVEHQIFSVILEMYMGWTDIRLRWNPNEYGGIRYIWQQQPATADPALVTTLQQASTTTPQQVGNAAAFPQYVIPGPTKADTKYQQLVFLINEIGKDLPQMYNGSKHCSEKVKRYLVHARILARECMMEADRERAKMTTGSS